MITGVDTYLSVGKQEILRCPECTIESNRHRPLTRLRVVAADPDGEYIRSVMPGEQVRLTVGPHNQTPAIWTGTVTAKQIGNTVDQTAILAVGPDLALSRTRCTQNFNNETPDAIVRWAVEQAGLTIGRIDAPGVVLPHFTASDIPVWQVARQCAHSCQRCFGLDMSRWALWMGADGAVNWGDFDEPCEKEIEVVRGHNLISYAPATETYGLNRVETFLTAGLRHSMRFRLVDTRHGINERVRALRVLHHLQPHQVRTMIWYGDEHAQY